MKNNKRCDSTMSAINEISSFLSKNRITLNEAFNIPDYGYGEEQGGDDESDFPVQREEPNQPQMGNDDAGAGVDGILKQIRILSLQGITQLAETPEDPNYDILKKIWVIVDKTTLDKNKEMGEEK